MKDAIINNEIPFSKLFLIGEDGEKIGVKTKEEVLEIARQMKLDALLIATSPKPIVRLINYGKFKYDKKKREKELKEKQTNIQNRQIRLTPLIGDNDLLIKSKKAREFLLHGDRVKVSLKFRGRELSRPEIGHETLSKFFALLEDIAKIDKEAKMTAGRFLDMVIHPDKKKISKFLKNKDEPQTNEENSLEQTNDKKE